MMADRDSIATSRFNCTARERACYEAGIKMGTIYHQFVGTPVSLSNVEDLERSIGNAIKVQPFVSDVKVKIDRSEFVMDGDRYSYKSLTGEMIDAVVTIKVDGVTLVSEMRYDAEMGYPLMFISDIRE
ncbi:MAG: dihydroneopterin aldolase family protein [Candidatus Methanomethylophilaceae archaeon]|nr:dihydroneopterin aldolase family protein [Candidatus Methanomethylophilaceae archaeon]